jgi:hypothetical protein
MDTITEQRRSALFLGCSPSCRALAFVATLVTLLAAVVPPTATAENRKPSATVTISQVNVAFMWSASLGGGTLTYRGKTYDFVIGGLGIGGLGASSLNASGDVYGLERPQDLEGVFAQARIGYAVGDESAGKLWLENPNGVVLALKARRSGLALAAGADGVVIKFK